MEGQLRHGHPRLAHGDFPSRSKHIKVAPTEQRVKGTLARVSSPDANIAEEHRAPEWRHRCAVQRAVGATIATVSHHARERPRCVGCLAC